MRRFFWLCQTASAMTNILLNMMGHMRWADALVAQALMANDARQPQQPPSGDPVRIFAHIASVEHLWYARIEGATPAHAVWPGFSPDEARAIAEHHAELFEQLIASGDEQLQRVVSYRNSAGRAFRNTVEEITTHVAMHGSYHRGQIARIIRAAGGDPPYTDYIQFIRRAQIA